MQSFDPKQQPKASSSPHRPRWKMILILLGIGCIGGLGLQYWLRLRQFDAAVQAYELNDCNQAIAGFKSFDGNPEVEEARQQCRDYLAINPGTQKPSEALAKALKFLKTHPSNAFRERKEASIGNPLKSGLKQQFNAHLNPERIQDWLSMEVCQELQKPTGNPFISSAMLLEGSSILPQSEESLPRLYHACGNFLVASKEVPAGIALLEMFLNNFPKHPDLNKVRRDHAMALIQEAKRNPTGKIPAPIATASTSDGSTRVVVRNDSRHALRIVFAGPTSQVEEMPACKDCKEYTRATAPSGGCPNKGPVKTYKLKPGGYQVLVKAISSNKWNASKLEVEELSQAELKQSSEVANVQPFTGQWSLGTGQEYRSCFFLIRG
ncbi:hypothetical protein CEN47_09640 [Fischerella thermalis CCMEE 5319]|nr:hypothetical protein CEN47_09640 [Fischerella thermalis CCMEE 5319]